jgi:hypothetical protein
MKADCAAPANFSPEPSELSCELFICGASIRDSSVQFPPFQNAPEIRAMSIPEKLKFKPHTKTSERSDFLWRGMPTA